MATGLETFDALRRATRGLPPGSEVKINRFDALDLCKLTPEDLKSRGFDDEAAVRVSTFMERTGSVAALGRQLGLQLVVEKGVADLIPGEGIRRTAGILADDPRTMDDIFDELDRIRHPENYVRG